MRPASEDTERLQTNEDQDCDEGMPLLGLISILLVLFSGAIYLLWKRLFGHEQAPQGRRQGPGGDDWRVQMEAARTMQQSDSLPLESRAPTQAATEQKGASWLVMLLVSAMIMACIGVGLLFVFESLPPQVTAALPEVAFLDRGAFGAFDSKPAPIPVLQEASAEQRLRQTERALQRLSSYGWVNREANVVHIPLERAMELVVQRGLPTRLPPAPASPTPPP